MKTILEIMEGLGIDVPEDKKAGLEQEIADSYRSATDYQNQVDKLKTVEDALKKFDGVDVAQLTGEIEKLKGDLVAKDTEYRAQLAERDFQSLLAERIASAKGKNAKAIAALLDLDTLKSSKNQKEDIASALDTLQKSDAYLFDSGTPAPQIVLPTGNGSAGDVDESRARAIMGLPPKP